MLLVGSQLSGVFAQGTVCQTIKVAIGNDPKEFTLGASGDFFLIDPGTGKELLAGTKEIKCKVSTDSATYSAISVDTFYTYEDADGFGNILCKRFPADPGKRVVAVDKGLFQLEIGAFKTDDDAKCAITNFLSDIPKATVVKTSLAGVSLGDSLVMKPPKDQKAWQFVIVRPMYNGYSMFNGKRYREKISLYMSGSKLWVVNELKFEDYLKGVVPSEMPASWPSEALKVQAVCARTYAYRYCLQPDHYCFNIGSSDGYQVYLGLDQETEKSNKAVDDTAGMMAIYNNEPINAVFHSTSGGMTENCENVWGSVVPYLKAVESPGEEESPRYAWMRFVSSDDLKSDLLEDTGDIGDIVDFTVVKKGVSGRIITCQVKGTKKTVTLDGDDVQWDIGLNSTWFDLVFITGGVVACGRGWGHGLGMSQYGSKAMAVTGKNYIEIVKHYYTGVEVKKWY